MTTLIETLRQGASISRDRNLNLDFAKVADEAADHIEALELLLKMKPKPIDVDDLKGHIEALEAQNKALRDAAIEFVRKVECGEARSTTSYAAFKAALEGTK